MVVDGDNPVPRARIERRRHLRLDVNLPGRLFIPADGREAPCRTVDMSVTGAQITCEVIPQAGAQIVVYIDGFGRFECDVIRADEKTFAVNFRCSALKQKKVEEQLTVLLNKGIVEATALRRHDRTPARGMAKFTSANGETVPCEVLDLSLSGLSLKTEGRPLLGEIIMIGQMSCRVVRYHETGIAVEFVNNIDRESHPSMAAR